jgi:hypothetical protein
MGTRKVRGRTDFRSAKSKHAMTAGQKSPLMFKQTQEHKRLDDAREIGVPWKKGGHIPVYLQPTSSEHNTDAGDSQCTAILAESRSRKLRLEVSGRTCDSYLRSLPVKRVKDVQRVRSIRSKSFSFVCVVG